jgi:hypothetical protein
VKVNIKKDQELIRKLPEIGNGVSKKVKFNNGEAFIEIARLSRHINIYAIPSFLEKEVLYLEILERIHDKRYDYCVLFCSREGKLLNPCIKNGERYYNAPLSVIAVEAFGDEIVFISEHTIMKTAGTATIEQRMLWDEMPRKLPESLNCYKDTVEKAVKKAIAKKNVVKRLK